MKKIYQHPETITVSVCTTPLLTASDPKVLIDTDGSVNAASLEGRRNRNLWDDEDDDF